MSLRPQISIAFPLQLAVPDQAAAQIEAVIAYLLGGGLTGTTGPPQTGGPVETTVPLPEPAPSGTDLISAIDDSTGDQHVQLAMRLGALLEGGSWSGPWNAGDNGLSWGPFQIYHVAHPEVTRAEAEDPLYAVRFMLPSYEAAANQVSPDLWLTDPKQAAALTVFHAERPLNMYPQSRIDAAWRQVAV